MAISLVVGGTGLVGSHVLKQLALVEECPVAILRRRPNDLPDNVKAIEVDFDELLTSGDLPQCDHLYLCLGTTIKTAGSQAAFRNVDFNYCLGIAQMAAKSGASVISLVSSVGADANSKNFYLRTKGQLEEAIKLLNFSSINIYRPGLLIGDRQEKRSADEFFLTRVHAEVPGDTFLEGFNDEEWTEVSRENYPANSQSELDYSICHLTRKHQNNSVE